jgi:hypothetical protein
MKIFILNNSYMGMVRQWQQLLHGNRLSHSYSEALPDFVKLAEPMAPSASAAEKPDELDDAIHGDDRRETAGDLRLRGGEPGQLLPDDPIRQGAQRNAARRGCARPGWW